MTILHCITPYYTLHRHAHTHTHTHTQTHAREHTLQTHARAHTHAKPILIETLIRYALQNRIYTTFCTCRHYKACNRRHSEKQKDIIDLHNFERLKSSIYNTQVQAFKTKALRFGHNSIKHEEEMPNRLAFKSEKKERKKKKKHYSKPCALKNG